MPARIDFFYDVASPFTYLTSTRIDREAQAVGVEVRWRPFLLGGVFKATQGFFAEFGP
ncbi:MAG: DsbA family protein, partial [Myxococcales bacterium]|nr:DsbA family protein [Myxococcales bacterium]